MSSHKTDKLYSALFLDRDGVINIRLIDNYVKKIEAFKFMEGVPQAIAKLNKMFNYVFVVTNQQGIGKGLMSEKDLTDIHNYMLRELEKHDAVITEVFHCPHKQQDNSFYRKPNVGMALSAKKKYPDINFRNSVMVGDSITDMQFGKRLKMQTVFISDNLKDRRDNYKIINFSYPDLLSFAKDLEVFL